MSNANLGVVLDGWIGPLRRHDLDALERHLRPDVVWQGVREDLACPDREHVLQNIRSTAGRLPEVESIDLSADEDQVLLGVRSPDLTEVADAILDGAIYNVFTIQDGLIARIEDFRTREEAVAAMRAHGAARGEAAAPASRVSATPVADLIAFVHVADVAASIAFYELLGFTAGDSHSIDHRLDWAALESGDAKLMLARADEPIHPGHQGVFFYLYAGDLAELQGHLRAHGVRVGAIGDGSPGPKREMRLRDPDGYVLIVAEIESG
jgi:catechol 2,3-dioxygenase-like lactoylglutathione lyase family enzyme/ketosteroid isomerase-like protein